MCVNTSDVMVILHCFPTLLRLKELHRLVLKTPDLRLVKVDAWFMKRACVLVKKKLTRRQWPRNDNFRALMGEVVGHQER